MGNKGVQREIMAQDGTKNLIPQNKRTKEQQREIARKGGKASGEARRAKKNIQDTLKQLMSMPLHTGKVDDLDAISSIAEMNGKNITVQEGVVLAQLSKALKGDARSATILIELLKLSQEKEENTGVQIIDDF